MAKWQLTKAAQYQSYTGLNKCEKPLLKRRVRFKIFVVHNLTIIDGNHQDIVWIKQNLLNLNYGDKIIRIYCG